MKAVLADFTLTVQGRTREEVIERLDAVSLSLLDHAGGAPWIMVDDDVKRIHAPQYALSDDQGFAYQGQRSYHYNGPALAGPGVRIHDNFNVQNGVD